MLKNHIIIGNGKWAKKILFFLTKYKIARQIVVISRKKKFIFFPKYKNLNKIEFNKILENSETGHICSPNDTHLKYFNFLSKLNIKFIVEKPMVNNIKEFKKIIFVKNQKYLVNYIDLFNYEFVKISRLFKKYKNKKVKINIIYSNNLQKDKDKNQLFNEWLDHPLAVILYINKRYSNFKIKKLELKKDNKGKYKQSLEVEYKSKKNEIKFLITNNFKKKRVIQIQTTNKKYSFNLGNHTNVKKSSFYRLYQNLKYINNSKLSFNLIFHKKVLNEKEKILKAINK